MTRKHRPIVLMVALSLTACGSRPIVEKTWRLDFAPLDLVTGRTQSDVVVRAEALGRIIDAETLGRIADTFQLRAPDGGIARVTRVRTDIPTGLPTDRYDFPPAEVWFRLDDAVQQGWYEARLPLTSVVRGESVADNREIAVDGRPVLTARFSMFPGPVVRRVISCGSKLALEFSEPVAAPTGSDGAVLVSLPDGVSDVECTLVGNGLNGAGARFQLNCARLATVDSFRVRLAPGRLRGLDSEEPVLDVGGEAFDRQVSRPGLRSDGQCSYFVP